MNGKRAKELREKARELNGNSRWSTFQRTQHPPKAIVDSRGVVVGHKDTFTDKCEGFRRIYQDLKKSKGLRRSGKRELLPELVVQSVEFPGRELVKLQRVLHREAERFEKSSKRADAKAKRRQEYLASLEDEGKGEE